MVFMKFLNQFLIVHHSFNIVIFLLIKLHGKRTLFVNYNVFLLGIQRWNLYINSRLIVDQQ